MSYLVDGNNVMGQRVGWHRDRVGARRRLLEDLVLFTQRKRVRMAVVFDGAPDEFFADGSSYKGVQVFYGARGSNADERIKQMVEASRERRTLLVITSDRALADYVRRCGARIISAGDFQRSIAAVARDEEKITDTGRAKSVAKEEVGEWMRYFGVAPEDDQEEK
ncbi:MAG: NYN domain-containing protein [Pyrinomonadaceae bacterium]|nr:NYN domain-containing protein [Pyrinomonadaceae bacterium]